MQAQSFGLLLSSHSSPGEWPRAMPTPSCCIAYPVIPHLLLSLAAGGNPLPWGWLSTLLGRQEPGMSGGSEEEAPSPCPRAWSAQALLD